MKCRMIMTVVFDKPFYKGVFERFVDDRYAVAEINLGTSLPKTRDIYRLVLKRWNTIHFSKETLDSTRVKRVNPKRMQREAQKQVHAQFYGSKAQQALKADFEMRKQQSHREQRIAKEDCKKRKFEIRQLKKKQKHRGH